LVVAQLALAVTLVTAAGLAVRTAVTLSAIPPGFDADRLLTFGLEFDPASYGDPAQARQAAGAIADRLTALPGVAGAALIEDLPAVGGERVVTLGVDGARPRPDDAPWAQQLGVGDGALETLGVPVIAGRSFSATEVASGAPLALVSLAAAERYFGGATSALGRRVRVVADGADQERQVIGVTGDVRAGDLAQGMPPRIWTPLPATRRLDVIVRAPGDPLDVAAAVRQALREVAPGLPLRDFESYRVSLDRRGASDRIVIGMFAGFAVLALVLATTGLYGLVAYSVSRRRAEFGTRFALGAQAGDVLRLVVRQAVVLLGAGLALGLAGGLAAATAMRGMFYGVGPADPVNLGVVVLMLTTVTLAAAAGPAWKASRVDPIEVLRNE
ncbi:MAG: FtsX-like permease family protein, partial [Vicinamibacterales bacterium]